MKKLIQYRNLTPTQKAAVVSRKHFNEIREHQICKVWYYACEFYDNPYVDREDVLDDPDYLECINDRVIDRVTDYVKASAAGSLDCL